MNKQVSVNILLVGIIIVLASVIGYLVFVKNAMAPTEPETSTTQDTETDTEAPNPSPTQDTDTDTEAGTGKENEKTYSNSSFEFTYPSVLTVKAQEGSVSVDHAVAYKHPNVCDFKGDAPDLEQITDFSVSLKVFDSGLKETMRANEVEDFVSTHFQGDTITIEPGYIDEANIGSLRGYSIAGTFEGCGRYDYYFPLSDNKTLLASRTIVTEFQPISADYQTYLKVPGVIPPTEEESFFRMIISSFKVK